MVDTGRSPRGRQDPKRHGDLRLERLTLGRPTWPGLDAWLCPQPPLAPPAKGGFRGVFSSERNAIVNRSSADDYRRGPPPVAGTWSRGGAA
jgi:hypothetical protein